MTVINPNTGVATPVEPKTRASRDWPLFFSSARDGALVIVTATYGMGYAIWAIYAWQYGLGVAPAADTQYFVAGAPAVVVLSLALLVLYWIPIGLSRLGDWFIRLPARRRASVFAATAVLLMLCYAIGYLYIDRKAWIFLAALLVAFVVQIVMIGILQGKRAVRAMLLSLFPLAIGALYLYAIWLYPHVPQELGGGQAKCVMLELRDDALSSTWRRLAIESRSHAILRLKATRPPSRLDKEVLAIRERELTVVMADETKKKTARSGPLLLWRETASELLVSVGSFDSTMEDRYVIHRSDVVAMRYLSDIGGRVENCDLDQE